MIHNNLNFNVKILDNAYRKELHSESNNCAILFLQQLCQTKLYYHNFSTLVLQ